MIRISQIKIEAEKQQKEVLPFYIAKKLKINKNDIQNYTIKKQSLDARNKEKIIYVYVIDVEIQNEKQILKKYQYDKDVIKSPNEVYQFPSFKRSLCNTKPIIVGSGPAGLFCAYLLAENGIKPLILERGEDIDTRVKTVENFWKHQILNENSNVQFGEGGAGTFSDGKLNTLNKDENNRQKKVMETFVKFGAPKEILYSYKPHIGTDILRMVIKNMREAIKSLGGEFKYNTCMTNIKICDNKIQSIEINNKKWLSCDTLILAIGHSARDTFRMLNSHNLAMNSKPFAIGLRIQHKQEDINESQYGSIYKNILGAASYKLTYLSSNNHGVYSFCMCPGGYVVNASSQKGHLAINGMSNHDRNTSNANSAIIVTVDKKTFGNSLFGGIELQEQLEKKAYNIGSGNIPVQLLGDYLKNKKSTSFKSIHPLIKGNYSFANLNELLPNEINEALHEAFPSFEKKIKGFNNEDAILAGIESRTSSPIKIIRDETYQSNIKGIYPCGEGAGYAGGITTSAIDGIKIAEAIAKSQT